MKILNLMVGALLLLSASSGFARTWTNYKGQKIEADLIKISGDKVILHFKGKDVKLAKEDLSKEDQEYLKKWEIKQNSGAFEEDEPKSSDKSTPSEKPKTTTKKPAAGDIAFGDSTMKTGGTVNKIEKPLTEATLKAFSKAKTKPSQLKLSIALPAGFDPSEPQKVMWASAAINTENERTRGNTGCIGAYAKTGAANGWVVIATDLDIGNPRRPSGEKSPKGDLALHTQAIELLEATWPGFKTWQFACCGHSGGAKASFSRVAQLLASEVNVIGLYLSGCNQNFTKSSSKTIRYKKSSLRKVKVYISNGKKDNISTVNHAESLEDSVKADRYGKVRLELFDGGHSFNRDEFKKALEWYTEPKA